MTVVALVPRRLVAVWAVASAIVDRLRARSADRRADRRREATRGAWRGAWSSCLPRRVATLSVHTSPLDQPGTGDAGGMNVYIVEVAKRLAAAGVEVEIFTRATCSRVCRRASRWRRASPCGTSAPGRSRGSRRKICRRRCARSRTGVLRAEAARAPGHYDLVHSHYWLSGQVGWLAKERWGVPLVHTAHTLAKVKNRLLADGDAPEPMARVIGEEQVVAEADRLVANTPTEARELIDLYGAHPRPGRGRRARRRPRPVPARPTGREAEVARRAARFGLPDRRSRRRVRRPDPAAEGARRAAARRRRAARTRPGHRPSG